MYCITDEQIDYILNDIRRNGIETEDLQLNLLDHICCIIEQNLEENGDFGEFYQKTVRQFYKLDLREIEEETTLLLTFKNYYAMKKLMIVSGTCAAAAFVLGSMFKAMHWPGASVLICLAIITFTFIFIPSLYVIKSKETKTTRAKLVLASGTLTGILYSLAVLFAIQHWPGVRILWFSTVSVSMFVFIPLYFFTGIRNPETKFNTIVSTVLFIGATGLLFTMLRVREEYPARMYEYIAAEQMLDKMQPPALSLEQSANKQAAAINRVCEQIKGAILQQEIGTPEIPADFERKKIVIAEKNLKGVFGFGKILGLLDELKTSVYAYNASMSGEHGKIPTAHLLVFADPKKVDYTDLGVLNNLVQLQMFLVNAEQQRLVVSK